MKKIKLSAIKSGTSIENTDKLIASTNTGLMLINKTNVSNYVRKSLSVDAGAAIDTGLTGVRIFTLHNANDGNVAFYLVGSTPSQVKVIDATKLTDYGVGESATETYAIYKKESNGTIWIKNNSATSKTFYIAIY